MMSLKSAWKVIAYLAGPSKSCSHSGHLKQGTQLGSAKTLQMNLGLSKCTHQESDKGAQLQIL
jgi:hypothetical protein